MNVFTYWEGPKPEYIDVCLKSMERICCNLPCVDFHLVTPENVQNYIDSRTLHSNFLKLDQIALRADCIRAALLAKHGGWWWDADTIGICSPVYLMARCKDASALYMSWTKPPRRVLNGYIYFAENNPIACKWLQQINEVLADKNQSPTWCSLGEKLLTDLLSTQSDACEIDRRLFLPIDIDSNVADFFNGADFIGLLDYLDDYKPICFGLNHSWFMFHKSAEMRLPSSEWKQSPLLIHQLLYHAKTLNEL